MSELAAGIVGRDADVLLPFYTDAMAFDVVDRLRFDGFGTVVKLRRGDARLKLFFPDAAVDAPATVEPWFRPGGWRYAELHVDEPHEVEELAAAVAAAGGDVLLPPAEHRPGARMALVADPECNAWEILFDEG